MSLHSSPEERFEMLKAEAHRLSVEEKELAMYQSNVTGGANQNKGHSGIGENDEVDEDTPYARSTETLNQPQLEKGGDAVIT